MSHRLIVCDVETTGLIQGVHVALEIAALDTATGEEMYIAPRVDPYAWQRADPVAMSINRYFERRVYEHIVPMSDEANLAHRLGEMLAGNTLGGSNPRFDLEMVRAFLDRHEVETEPHHRLADLSAYAAGVLDLDPTELPGLAEVCRRVGLATAPDHTAMQDARVTWRCFKALREIRAGVRQVIA